MSRSQRASPVSNREPEREVAPEAPSLGLLGNGAARDALGGGDHPDEPHGLLEDLTRTATPPTPPADPGADDDLPFRAEMEAAFGEDFGAVETTLGAGSLRTLGAHATAAGDHVAFASAQPDRRTVAHELTHVVQARRSSGDGVRARSTVNAGSDAAEVEAEAVGARVASGGDAGTIGATPTADVHRDAAGPAPSSTTKTLNGQTLTVFPDLIYAALTVMGALPGTISTSEYQRRVDEAGRQLVTRLVALHALGPIDWLDHGASDQSNLVIGADPDVRTAAFRLLSEDPAVQASVALGQKLAKVLDPVLELRQILDSDLETDQKLGLLTGWAKRYGPDVCTRALADGDVQVRLNTALGNAPSVRARQLLIGAGTIDDSPKSRLLSAMYARDSAGFLLIWAGLRVTDPPQVVALLASTVWLEDVRTWVKDAYPTVMNDLATFSPTATPTGPDALNREALAATANPLAEQIAADVRATGAPSTWLGDDDTADPVFASAATRVYTFRREAVAREGMDLATEEGRAAATALEKTAIEVLRSALPLTALLEYGSTEGRAPFLRSIESADHEVGKRILRDGGQTALSPEELATITTTAERTATALVAVDVGGFDSEGKAQQLLDVFSRELFPMLRARAAGPQEDWVASERRRRADEVLDQVFRARTGRSLRSWLATLQGTNPFARGALASAWDERRTERDIEADPDAYSDVLTSLDDKRLRPLFDRHAAVLGPLITQAGKTPQLGLTPPAGLQVAGEWPHLQLRVDRAFVSRDLGALEGEVRETLEPVKKDGPKLAAWERKVRRAMKAFEHALDASHGSLRTAIDDGRGEATDQRDALTRLGDRDESTFALQQQVLVGTKGDATATHTFLREAAPAVDTLARQLATALAPTMRPPPPLPTTGLEAAGRLLAPSVEQEVSDAQVGLLASQFSLLAVRYVSNVPGSTRADATRMLTTAFAPLGGSLAPLVARGLSPENADRALSDLGLSWKGIGGTQTADLALIAGPGVAPVRQEDDATFTTRLEHRAVAFSRSLAALTGDAGTERRVTRLAGLLGDAQQLLALARLAEGGDGRLRKLWTERIGIDLDVDLGRHLRGDAERQAMSARFGVPVRDLSGEASVPGSMALMMGVGSQPGDPLDPYAFLRAAGVTPQEVSPEFDVYEARRRAIRLHEALGGLPGTERDVRDLLAGPPAEMKVVRGLFHQTFGYDPRYRLLQVFPDDPTAVNTYSDLVDTAGKGSAGQQLLAYARTKDIKEVLRLTLRMSQSERDAILGNSQVLGGLRIQLGNDYGPLYDTLSGHADLYDVVRSDKDVGNHVEAYFEGRRRTLTEDPALQAEAGGDERKLAALVARRLQQEGRAAYADPAMRKLLDEKFGETKDFEVRARMLGGGTLSNLDRAYKAVADPDGTDETELRAAFEAMTPEERNAVRTNPSLQRKFASDLEEQDGDVKDSRRIYAELFADKGEDGLAKLEAARKAPNEMRVRSGPEYDGGKVMDAILGMSRAELATLRADGGALQRIRASLDEGQRKRLDAHLAGTAAIARDDETGFLVERYVGRFLDKRSSEKGALGVAQDCFNDKGPKGSPFGGDQRRLIWSRIGSELDLDGWAHDAVKHSLLIGVDPTGARIHQAFDGKDNQAEILASIDNAGIATVIGWSNVEVAGPTAEYGSLKGKFATYLQTEREYSAAKMAGGAVDPRLEERYLADRNRFWDHRLDLSAGGIDYFSGGGGDLKFQQVFNGIAFGPAVADTPSKKRLLEMKEHVRKRIWALSNDDVAARVGLVEPTPLGKDAGPDEQAKFDAEKATYESRRDGMMSDDRLARSEYVQRSDVYSHERGDGSGSGADTEGARVDIAHDLYRTELDHDLADGRLSKEEVARVKLAGGDFDRKVQEYKEAKAKLGSILKFIARALILAVAIALTGPGAMGLLATLLVAGTSAMADNVIDSVVMGNDFDWEEDGVNHVLKEVGVAAFTFGVGKAFQAVSAPLGIAGAVNKVAAFEGRLAEGATKSFGGLALNYAYQSGKSVVMSPLAVVSETAIDMIDPSEWKYGFDDYAAFAGETFSTKMDTMAAGLKGELAENLASGLFALGRSKLGGKKAGTLPGIATPETPRDRSLSASVTKIAGQSLVGLTDEALKLVARKVAAGNADGMAFTEDEVLDYLARVSGRAMKSVGTDVGTKRKNSAVEARIEADRESFADDPSALPHYRAHLEGSTMGLLGGLHADPASFRQAFAKTRAEIAARVARATDPALGQAYAAWVLGAPDELQKRMAVDVDTFESRYRAGTENLAAVRNSKAYADLDPDERRLYERSAGDTGAVLGMGGKGSVLALDAGGGLGRFSAAARNTVVTTVADRATPVTSGWDSTKQRAFEAHLQEAKLDRLRAASGEDEETARIHAVKLALAFDRTYEIEAAKRAAGTTYTGEAPDLTLPTPRTPIVRAGPDEVTGRYAAVQAPPGFELDHHTTDRHEAMAEYRKRVDAEDTLEVGVYYDWETGEFAVVRGAERSVGWPSRVGRSWALVEHWHPREKGKAWSSPVAKFPSGQEADMGILHRQALATNEIAMSAISSEQPWGRSRTLYGYDPHAKVFFVDYGTGTDADGKETRYRREFLDLDEYRVFIEVRLGEIHAEPDPGGPGTSTPGPKAAVTAGTARSPDADRPGPEDTIWVQYGKGRVVEHPASDVTGDPARGNTVSVGGQTGVVVGFGPPPHSRDVKHPPDPMTLPVPKPLAWDPNVPVAKQLAGKGQLADLRSSPNFDGVDVEELLRKTPRELETMVRDGKLSNANRKRIMKAFEDRDLGRSGA